MSDTDEQSRLESLIAAEERAFDLLAAIETSGVVAPGRRESEVDRDIQHIAEEEFGIARNWHKRLVRTGANTVFTFHDNPPERSIEAEDTVYVDLGPVFEGWEADVGRSYAVGQDEARAALVAALPVVFEEVRAHANATPDITGAELYAFAVAAAERHGYHFGGKIAGHIVGEFSHLIWPSNKDHERIGPANPTRLSDPDPYGRRRYWIIEVHLVAPDRSYGGFYERLLRP